MKAAEKTAMLERMHTKLNASPGYPEVQATATNPDKLGEFMIELGNAVDDKQLEADKALFIAGTYISVMLSNNGSVEAAVGFAHILHECLVTSGKVSVE